MNESSQAKAHFIAAFQIAIDTNWFLSLVHTLTGIALLFIDQGDVARAVELYSLASTVGMVANSKWFADIAGDEIAQAAEGLPAEVVETAKSRGRSLDLWETAEALLVELEQAGWGNELPKSTETIQHPV